MNVAMIVKVVMIFIMTSKYGECTYPFQVLKYLFQSNDHLLLKMFRRAPRS